MVFPFLQSFSNDVSKKTASSGSPRLGAPTVAKNRSHRRGHLTSRPNTIVVTKASNLEPLFPANALLRRGVLPVSEQNQRAHVLEQLLEVEKEEKDLEEQVERRRLLRKELLARLNQVPKRN
jgi:hypothetical protein